MTPRRKEKISITVDADLLDVVDRMAAREGATRSGFMEAVLRQLSHRAKVTRLEEETAAYYDALTKAEREDDASWAAASSNAARKLQVDEPSKAATEAATAPAKRGRVRRRA
jgi:metal-responsive CopG/Arc/MetJ family transcriptional regulator